jgi:hypothetical protein
MHDVNQLLGYWSENPPVHVMLKGFFETKKRPGVSVPGPRSSKVEDTSHSDIGRLMGAGMASVRGRPKKGVAE